MNLCSKGVFTVLCPVINVCKAVNKRAHNMIPRESYLLSLINLMIIDILLQDHVGVQFLLGELGQENAERTDFRLSPVCLKT